MSARALLGKVDIAHTASAVLTPPRIAFRQALVAEFLTILSALLFTFR